MTNRLAKETSPYLLQHAENPVDWYPWGPEAFERAKREGKPLVLSVGYAACHWCHVMERESFENEAVAKLMNEHFVCIKVDREERPDVDEVYMAATVTMSGHGGWPMTVFLTPEQKPFFAGTYFPPTDQYGRPGFASLLSRIAELWSQQRGELEREAEALTERMTAQAKTSAPKNVLSDGMARAARTLAGQYDAPHGGFGRAPKFPPTAQLSLLLREHRRTGDPSLLEPVTGTLAGMMNGGIYDHLGGGFARYSTDDRWLVPHFEKMLYDNALVSRVYLEAFQVTQNDDYARIARETLDYIVREMQGPEGGYYSATDADSEGEEGKYFVWTPEAVDRVLDDADAEAFCAYYDVTPQGNWEGVSVLNTPRPQGEVAADLGVERAALEERLERAKKRLFEARSERVPPLLDDKVIVSWNGLMIGAMAEGARVLGDERYLDSAKRAAAFIRETLTAPGGRLLRTYRAGRAHLDACLEDYAYLVDALVDLYEASGDRETANDFVSLADRMVRDFSDPAGGGFFHTAHDSEALLVRVREGHDGALPSPNAVAARALIRVGRHQDRPDLVEHGAGIVRAFGGDLERMPRAFCSLLMAAELVFEPPVELVLAGAKDDPRTGALAREAATHFIPNRVIVWTDGLTEKEQSRLPLTAGKAPVGGRPALFVCRDFACEAPITDPPGVAGSLGEVSRAAAAARRASLVTRLRPGRATADGTRAHASRFEKGPSYGMCGETGLSVSRVGFGGYRVTEDNDEHRAALEKALGSGVNLVDTSPNYSDGRSELLVGSVIGSLIDEGDLVRDALIVVTKVGYVVGGDGAGSADAAAPPGIVTITDGLGYSIHPDWIATEIDRSRSRLGLETLDAVLLHNPETLLKADSDAGQPIEAARAAWYERIETAFRQLEAEVDAGKIARYGLSTNTAHTLESDAEHVDVARLVEAAERVAGRDHHFELLQVPLNLFEAGVAIGPGPSDADTPTVLQQARAAGLAVLTNRPLNAIVAGNVVRLADPPEVADANLSRALERTRKLEETFEQQFAPMLRTPDGSTVTEKILDFARQLREVAAQSEGYEAWRELERRMVAPGVARTLGLLDEAFQPSGVQAWPRFKAEYITTLKDLTRGVAARAASRSRARARRIRGIVGPALPSWMADAPLSHVALGTVASVPGVSAVLVGMREDRYVVDAIEALRRPAVDDPLAILERGQAADVD